MINYGKMIEAGLRAAKHAGHRKSLTGMLKTLRARLHKHHGKHPRYLKYIKGKGGYGIGDFFSGLGSAIAEVPAAFVRGVGSAAEMAPAMLAARMIGGGEYNAVGGGVPSVVGILGDRPGGGVAANEIVDPGAPWSRVPLRMYTPDKEDASLVLEHREYIGDVIGPPVPTGNSLDTWNTLALNPGLPQTFPLLSRFAQLFEEYEFEQLIFRCKSIVAPGNNASQGTWEAAVIYNPTGANFSTKSALDNAEFSTSNPINQNMVIGVECAKNKTAISTCLYTRYSDLPAGAAITDYDKGKVQIATSNTPPQAGGFPVGEVWVYYRCKLSKLRTQSQPPVSLGGGISWQMGQNSGQADVYTASTAAAFLCGVDLPTTVAAPTVFGSPSQPLTLPIFLPNNGAWPAFPVSLISGLETGAGDGLDISQYLQGFSCANQEVLIYGTLAMTALGANTKDSAFQLTLTFQFNMVAGGVYSVTLPTSTFNAYAGEESPTWSIAAFQVPTLSAVGNCTVTKLANTWFPCVGVSFNASKLNVNVVNFGWTITAGSSGGQCVATMIWNCPAAASRPAQDTVPTTLGLNFVRTT